MSSGLQTDILNDPFTPLVLGDLTSESNLVCSGIEPFDPAMFKLSLHTD